MTLIKEKKREAELPKPDRYVSARLCHLSLAGKAESTDTCGVQASTYNHHFLDTAAYQIQLAPKSFLMITQVMHGIGLLLSKGYFPTKVNHHNLHFLRGPVPKITCT